MIQQLQDAVQSIAAEDVSVGDTIVVMDLTLQLPSFLWWHESISIAHPSMVYLKWMPCEAGIPFEVLSICLPFFLVENPDGTRETLDLRQCRIARCSAAYAEKVRKAATKNRKRRQANL